MHKTLAWILGIILGIYLLIVSFIYNIGGKILYFIFITDIRIILIIIAFIGLMIVFARKGVFKN